MFERTDLLARLDTFRLRESELWLAYQKAPDDERKEICKVLESVFTARNKLVQKILALKDGEVEKNLSYEPFQN